MKLIITQLKTAPGAPPEYDLDQPGRRRDAHLCKAGTPAGPDWHLNVFNSRYKKPVCVCDTVIIPAHDATRPAARPDWNEVLHTLEELP